MVIHVGFDPYSGQYSTYDTVKKKISKHELDYDWHFSDDPDIIVSEIDKIKFDIKEKLGCACIYLPAYFPYKLRKYFIEFVTLKGFQKIEIINFDALQVYKVFLQANYEPENSEIFLICSYPESFLWQYKHRVCKLINRLDFRNTSFTTFEDEIKKLLIEPKMIFYFYDVYFKKVKKLFTNSRNILLGNCANSYGALYRARMIGNDQDIIYFTAENYIYTLNLCFDRFHTDVVIRSSLYPLSEVGEALPLTKGNTLKNDENILRVIYNYRKKEFPLPDLQKLFIIVTIDTNEICSLTYCDISNNSECEFEPLTYTKTTLRYTETMDIFTFPEKIQINNDQINAVGIDLGTSRCCAAVNRKNGIETVALDNLGQRLLPSYVAFDEINDKCGQLVIDRLRNYAKYSAFDFKRIIGKNYNEINIDKSWPFEIKKCFLLKPEPADNTNEEFDGQYLIKICTKNGFAFKYPEEISAVLLKHIKQKAEEFQGKQLTEAVITVPAAFNEKQKQATFEAGIHAGWEIVHLLPEPVAAAFAYFIDRPIPNNSTLLLFDLGGGTLDVCIFKIENNNQLQIISRSGDPNIGGRDFDNLLINFFESKMKKEFNVEVTEGKKYKLMIKCQSIKENLSTMQMDDLDVEEIDSTVDAYIPITREEFETLSADLLDQIREEINNSLKKINMKPKQIDKVLQVGGGCRMPMIKKLLKKIFSDSEHCCEEHPDEVVAIGAAYYAYYLNLQREKKSACSVM